MYTDFFGLTQHPFTLTPNPDFLFFSPQHEEALAHLIYALSSGNSGFSAITGSVGIGKTTLIRYLLENLPENTKVGLVFNSNLTPSQLLKAICDDLSIPYKTHDSQHLIDCLNQFLLQCHQNNKLVVLIIDEAQNLSNASLEQVRLLTNLETTTDKLLQIILIGQSELKNKLTQHSLRQLAQRIAIRYHLKPLTFAQTKQYIIHRLKVAGTNQKIFTRNAYKLIFKHTNGIPRLINIIADRALLIAFTKNTKKVNKKIIDHALNETSQSSRSLKRRKKLLIANMIFIILGIIYWLYPSKTNHFENSNTLATISNNDPPQSTQPITTSPIVPINQSFYYKKHWLALAALWQENEPIFADELIFNNDGCPKLIHKSYRCVKLINNWKHVLRFNRPILLAFPLGKLSLVSNNIQQQLTITINNETSIFNPDIHLNGWLGEAYILFKIPKSIPNIMQAGDSGPAVSWVTALIYNITHPEESPKFNSFFSKRIETQVMKIQEQMGLIANGIIDDITLLAITSLAKKPLNPSLNQQHNLDNLL